MALTGRPLAATLAHHIQHVLSLRGNKEMAGIDTVPCVAGMADHKAGWNLADRQFISDTMCPEKRLSAIGTNAAVAASIDGTDPRPTFIRTALVDLLPKAFSQRSRLASFTPGHRAAPIPSK